MPSTRRRTRLKRRRESSSPCSRRASSSSMGKPGVNRSLHVPGLTVREFAVRGPDCRVFEAGFDCHRYKLADPKDVMRSFQPTGVVLIPEEEELKSIVDRASELMTDFTPQKAMDALKV
eukprot:14264050-Ditylum_brightwellii.AAC.1